MPQLMPLMWWSSIFMMVYVVFMLLVLYSCKMFYNIMLSNSFIESEMMLLW